MDRLTKIIRLTAKCLLIVSRNNSILSTRPLRTIRWNLYRYVYNSPGLFVDEGVVIVGAHKSNNANFLCSGTVRLGRHVYIDYSGGVTINGDVTISQGAKIFTHLHPIHEGNANWHLNEVKFIPLLIEQYSWIGAGAIVLPTVKQIGEGSIVAAGAVLAEDTHPYSIYAGVPAKLVGWRQVSQPQC